MEKSLQLILVTAYDTPANASQYAVVFSAEVLPWKLISPWQTLYVECD